MGATSSMLWWPDGFCAALAARRRYVIRFDHRDTGRSTFWPPGAPGYTLADMAEDPIRIMDGLGLPAAHLVGMSMGGVLAQHTALRFPDRVLTLTAIASTPVGGERDLPGMSADYAAHAARAAGLDWTDRTELASFRAADAAALAGTAHPHDSAAVQRLIQQEFERAPSVASAVNHFIVPAGDTEADRTEDLRLPLLVIHGTADPLFPRAHGAALAEAVPGARLAGMNSTPPTGRRWSPPSSPIPAQPPSRLPPNPRSARPAPSPRGPACPIRRSCSSRPTAVR